MEHSSSDLVYYPIPNYTMKCRLYPNKTQAKQIDEILFAVRLAYNHTLYEIFNDGMHLKEPDAKGNHYVDFKELGSADHRKHLMSVDSRISVIPSSVLSGYGGIFHSDLKRAMSLPPKQKGKPRQNTPRVSKTGALLPYPVEQATPFFYGRRKDRTSYTYQETCSKVSSTENKNVCRINLARIGSVKIRGWNRKLRFGAEQQYNFVEWMQKNSKQHLTITISKDACGDYFICFKLSKNFQTFGAMNAPTDEITGISIGIDTAVVTADGNRYDNQQYKAKQEARLAILNRQLSRREGPANIRFREHQTAMKKDGVYVPPSKRYVKTRRKYAYVHRKVARKRNHHNNQTTHDLIKKYGKIGVESLNVSGMMHNKHLAKKIADVAPATILTQLDYKSAWYGREYVPIDKNNDYTCTCCRCGNINRHVTFGTTQWICPECGASHDRDINAAINVQRIAFIDS